MRSLPIFPSSLSNLQLLEEVLYDLPLLEGIFLHWHRYGVTATTAGMRLLLARRRQLLGPTTLSAASIQLQYECATDSLCGQAEHSPWDSRPLHARLLRHTPSLKAAKTQAALLPPGVLEHKTVSMTIDETSFLCTGIGPHRLTRKQRCAISAILSLPGRPLKQSSSNPVCSNPIEMFGMQQAMVSPFLYSSHHAEVSALVLMPWPKEREQQACEVAIALSLWESLLLPVRCLRQVIWSYAKRAFPTAWLIKLESEDGLDAYAEQRIS
jgi:hypothetical protein